MKKVLIVANTYFQLIMAVNMKLSIFLQNNVDLIVTDETKDSKKIVENTKRVNIFSNVYHATLKEKDKKNFISKAANLCFINLETLLENRVKLKEYKYDMLLTYNYNMFAHILYNCLKRYNKNIVANRYEEGFGSYLYKDERIKLKGYKLKKIIRKLALKYNIENEIKEYYFMNPDMVIYKSDEKLTKIQSLNRKNKNLVKILNTIFDYNPNKNEYKQKYIFFEESFFCDNKGIDDLDLILKIADIVGKDNLLVKLHPRNRVDRFKEYGITTNKTIGIPWEVIQMNNDFSDKVFLTISSGSVLASKLYYGDNIKTYLLFNCTEKMSDMVTEETFEYLEKMNEKFDMNDFIIPKNKEVFFEMLKNNK